VVKLQKEKSYKYKDHEIFRYRLNITPEIVGDLGWKDGTELELKVKNNKLEVSKA
jgi:hypothetical protein